MPQPRPLTAAAKSLRKTATKAEHVLWQELRAHRFHGHEFKRQEPMGAYVVDFACYASKLVIGLDGWHHAGQIDADARRTAWPGSGGFRVIRFWNDEVLQNPAGVLNRIEEGLGES